MILKMPLICLQLQVRMEDASSGIGSTKEHALNECTKWQEENNIVGTCELYGRSGEVVWDGHLKPSK